MKKSEKITRPIVYSQLQAEALATQWDQLHNFDILVDAVGIRWSLEETTQLERVGPHALVWRSILQLRAKVTAKDLLETHTLSSTEDARLLRKMGADAYLLRLPPHSLTAPQEKELQQLCLDQKITLKVSMRNDPLHEKKRALLEKEINARCGFLRFPPSGSLLSTM
jgi:hypothetical protein